MHKARVEHPDPLHADQIRPSPPVTDLFGFLSARKLVGYSGCCSATERATT
jgi:hypothetical protein